MRRTLILSVALIMGGTAAASAAIHGDIHRTFNVREGGTLTLEAGVGAVHVTSGGSGVSVDVIREARTQSQSEADRIFRDNDVAFEQLGDDVTVRSRSDRDWTFFEHGTPLFTRYEVRVPARYGLSIRTAGSSIDVGDLNGNVDCRTSGGNVKLGRVGSVQARTSGGNIDIGDASGAVEAHTSGGSIRVDSSAGGVIAKTSGGSIQIGQARGAVMARTSGGGIRIGEVFDTVDASTSGGSIVARIAGQPHGDSRLSTSGGGITVELAAKVGVELDAHASGGGVHSDVPVTILGRAGDNALNGRVNGGGPRLVLRSSGGGVTLRGF